MTISQTTRFSIYRWSADTDAFTRTQLDASHENIELYAAKMLSGASLPAASAIYARTIFLLTTTNKLYYYDKEDASGTWRILETAVIQNTLADAKGDLIVASANDTWAKLSVGSETQILTVGASSTVGWAAPVIQTPAGTISATVAAAAPSGWLFLEGQTIASASTTYPILWSVLPAAWKSGTSLVLPDWRGRYMASYKAADTNFGTLGSTVTGATTIASANLPTHVHDIGHGHGTATTTTVDIAHTHSVPVHGHTASTANGGAAHTHDIGHGHGTTNTVASDISHTHSVPVHGHTASSSTGGVAHTHDIAHGHTATNTAASDISHTHTMAHGHTVGVNTGLSGNDSPTHAHSIGHTHAATTTGSVGGHRHVPDGSDGTLGFVRRRANYIDTPYDTNSPSSGAGIATDVVNYTGYAGDHDHTTPARTHTGNSGDATVNHKHSVVVDAVTTSTISGAMSANGTTHVHSFTPIAFAGNSGSTTATHTHPVTVVDAAASTSGAMSANATTHVHSFTPTALVGNSGSTTATHNHAVTVVDAAASTSGAMSANGTHSHSFTPTAHTGNSGNGGFANSSYVMPAGVINWMIKAH